MSYLIAVLMGRLDDLMYAFPCSGESGIRLNDLFWTFETSSIKAQFAA